MHVAKNEVREEPENAIMKNKSYIKNKDTHSFDILLAIIFLLILGCIFFVLADNKQDLSDNFKDKESTSYSKPDITRISKPDFGPYMNELQRRIKRNWTPPRGNESKKVVLLFKVSRKGELLSLKVLRSSGIVDVDNAAMKAVKLTAPFDPLPLEYKDNDIDIQFTFDYNAVPR